MTDREEELRQLIATVQQQPQGSLPWRRALNRLILQIQQLPGLVRSPHPDYGEALNDVLLKLGNEIQQFQPAQGTLTDSLTAWINLKLRLKYAVLDLHRPPQARNRSVASKGAQTEFQAQVRQPPLSLDAPLGDNETASFLDQLPAPGPYTLWQIESAIQQAQAQQQQQQIGLRLQQYIQHDPDQRLRQCHPQAHPDCHCQLLSQRLLLKHPPDRLASLAREFNINYHTLNWHWKNRCIPLLRTIAQRMGYQPDKEMNS